MDVRNILAQWPLLEQIRTGGDGTGHEAMSVATRAIGRRNAGTKCRAVGVPVLCGWLRSAGVPPQTTSNTLGALFGTVMATYTGVLVGATAIPVWNENVRLLLLHFGASGVAYPLRSDGPGAQPDRRPVSSRGRRARASRRRRARTRRDRLHFSPGSSSSAAKNVQTPHLLNKSGTYQRA